MLILHFNILDGIDFEYNYRHTGFHLPKLSQAVSDGLAHNF